MANDLCSAGGFTRSITLISSFLAVIGAANADPRNKAPIRYGPAPNAQAYHLSQSQPSGHPSINNRVALASASASRTEFRYPDQPHVAYGNQNGPRLLGSDAPLLAFSSSDAVISPEQAATHTALEPTTAKPTVGQPLAQPQTVSPIPPKGKVTVLQPTDTDAVLAPADRFESQRAGKPYKIANEWYTPEVDPHYDSVGTASWYGPNFHGKLTANGEIFDQEGMTAAHPTLPIPSLVQVINLENGREVVVRVNDRGPFIDNRIIDMSKRSAEVLGFKNDGHAQVRVRYLGPAPTLPEGIHTVAHKDTNPPATPTPATAAPVAELPTPTVSFPEYGSTHYVQVGSFTDIANARVLHDRFVGKYDVDIVTARVRGADFFRVMVGPVSDETAAERLRDQIAAQGLGNGIVVAAN